MEWLELADGLGAFGLALLLLWGLLGDDPRLMTRGHHRQVVDLLVSQNQELVNELERHREALWRSIRASGWGEESDDTSRTSGSGSPTRKPRVPARKS